MRADTKLVERLVEGAVRFADGKVRGYRNSIQVSGQVAGKQVGKGSTPIRDPRGIVKNTPYLRGAVDGERLLLTNSANVLSRDRSEEQECYG
jgi:hypothetical protein